MSTARKDMRSGYYKDDMGMKGGPMMMKKGGRVGKKKQGYKDRKDESIAMRIRKKRTKKQLKASRDESYGKFDLKLKNLERLIDSERSKKKVRKVMREFKKGKLNIGGSKKKVKPKASNCYRSF